MVIELSETQFTALKDYYGKRLSELQREIEEISSVLTQIVHSSAPEPTANVFHRKDDIIKAVEDVFDLKVTERTRKRSYANARKICAWLLCNHTGLTLKEIAKELNLFDGEEPDHTMVIYYRDWMRNNQSKMQHYLGLVYKILSLQSAEYL